MAKTTTLEISRDQLELTEDVRTKINAKLRELHQLQQLTVQLDTTLRIDRDVVAWGISYHT